MTYICKVSFEEIFTYCSWGCHVGSKSLATTSFGSLSNAELGGTKIVNVPSLDKVLVRPARSTAMAVKDNFHNDVIIMNHERTKKEREESLTKSTEISSTSHNVIDTVGLRCFNKSLCGCCISWWKQYLVNYLNNTVACNDVSSDNIGVIHRDTLIRDGNSNQISIEGLDISIR